jgi:glycosyltransferase involved in cell wall biosynthesis
MTAIPSHKCMPSPVSQVVRPRVVVICRSFYATTFGGVLNVRERVNLMRELGYDVLLIHGNPDQSCEGTVAPTIEPNCGRLQSLHREAFFDESVRRLINPARIVRRRRQIGEVIQLCTAASTVAVMVHGERPHRFYLKLQALVPLYYFRHDSSIVPRSNWTDDWADPWFARERGLRKAALLLRRRWEFRRVRRVKRFVANSQYIAELHEHGGTLVQHPPVSVCPAPNPDTEARVLTHLLFVARLEHAKGPQDAIRMLSLLPPQYSLTIVGTGELRAELGAQALSLGVADRVKFCGQLAREQVLGLMRSVGVVIVPSLVDEAFGAVGVEAFACGTPVMAYRVGGIPEWCRLPAGELVERGDIHASAQVIRAITSSHDEWEKRSRAARAIVDTDFNYEKFRRSMSDLLTNRATV